MTSLLLDQIKFQVEVYNNEFVLLKTETASDIHHIGLSILKKELDFIDEVIATEIEICLKVNELFTPSKLSDLKELEFVKNSENKNINIPIWFDGKNDIANVIRHSGKTETQIIESLEQSLFSVAMLGFLPGFVYLNGLDKSLHTPRKTTPSKYIAANSLAIGNNYVGIYSLPSPGGWNVIGKLGCSILNIPELPPIHLSQGHEIKFVPIGEKLFEELQNNKIDLITYNG